MPLDHLPGTFFGPSNLVDLIRHRVRHQPEDAAFVFLVDGEDEQVVLTYRQLDKQARAIGAWLESLGLQGERALLLYPAGLEFIEAFFGCLYAGVVAVPVYPPRRNRSLARIQAVADDAKAKVALTTDVVLSRVQPLIGETPNLKELTWLATCHTPEGMDERWQSPDVHGDTMSFLQYTSGSTGAPKGVMVSHANMLHNSALISYAFEHTRSGAGVFWLPSYHDMGLIGGILQPLYMGRPNIIMSPMAFLQKPFRWLSAISRFRATTSGGPNFAYDLCVRKVTPEQREQLDLSSWRVAFNGAEPVRAETLDRFSETFAPHGFRAEAFYPCYGMAEATLIVSGGQAAEVPVVRWFDSESLSHGRAVETKPGSEGAHKLVSSGGALPDQRILIVDPDELIPRDDGQVGEIWVNSPSVAQGYWGKPELTEAVFRARLKDSGTGPFLRTGDLGFFREGELFVTGRIKDLIILHGVNYYPQDIEMTVQRAHHRLRGDCGAVFSVEAGGREHLVVVQEIERHKKGDLDTVFDAIRRAISSEHELGVDAILLIKAGSIPKTSSGKVQRHACRNGYLNGSLNVVGQWQAPGVEAVLAAARPQPKGPAPTAAPAGLESTPTALPPAAPPSPAPDDERKKPTALPVPKASIVAVVMEQINEVGKERVAGLRPDHSIVATGLDSLERMEILARLEERFGGRLPEHILPELGTANQVAAAVQKYVGSEPRAESGLAEGAEVPSEYHQIAEFPEYARLRRNLDMLAASGIKNPFFTVHQGLVNDRTIIDGRELINFSGYNYLGMSGDPLVAEATKAAVDKYGTSVSASRLVAGEKDLHGELEREIARFTRTEAAIVMVGGHATNETVIGHLLGPGDLILHDALSHNSIIQGCILSGARRRPFAHNDYRAADRLLKEYRHQYRRVLMVVEGVYSMDGDVPDLPAFIEVKKRHKALLMVDEAHSIGTLGATGHGIGEHFGVKADDVDIWMCTLSKTFGSCGGFIAGCKELVEYLKYTAPGFVFSVGLSPPNTAAALASLRLLEAEPQRVRRLQENARLFLELAKQRGLNTGMSKDSPVVPVIVGNSLDCLRLSGAMTDRGVNVQPIIHPAVEESAARLRFFITSNHTEEQIRFTVDAVAEELRNIATDYFTPTSPDNGASTSSV